MRIPRKTSREGQRLGYGIRSDGKLNQTEEFVAVPDQNPLVRVLALKDMAQAGEGNPQMSVQTAWSRAATYVMQKFPVLTQFLRQMLADEVLF